MSRYKLFSWIVVCLLLAVPVGAERPAICELADTFDPDSEIEASPRQNFTAEYLALARSQGFAADPHLYDLISVDVDQLESAYPDLVHLPVHAVFHDNIRLDWIDEEARERALNGEIESYSCLVEEVLTFENAFDPAPAAGNGVFLKVVFDGIYDTALLIDLLETLPEVEKGYPVDPPYDSSTGCYYSPDGERRVYFFAYPGRGDVLPFWVQAEDWYDLALPRLVEAIGLSQGLRERRPYGPSQTVPRSRGPSQPRSRPYRMEVYAVSSTLGRRVLPVA